MEIEHSWKRRLTLGTVFLLVLEALPLEKGLSMSVSSHLRNGAQLTLSAVPGPVLVALGASLWATDSLFRAHVIHHASALMIVTINHSLLFLPSLFLLYKHREELRDLTPKEWFGLVYVAVMVSVMGAVAFTEAFAHTSNYSVPVLIQKVQPCFAIVLGHLLVRESVRSRFWGFAAMALMGTYLLSFGLRRAWVDMGRGDLEAIAYALLAALLWGSGTVVGRLLLRKMNFPVVTAARFLIGSLFSVLFFGVSQLFSTETWPALGEALVGDFWNYVAMAFLSGLIPMWIYYRGLRSTPVPVAALCELTFPIVAIFLNWIYLGATLSSVQIFGAALILFAVSAISLRG